jgi:D-amino-acid dehydrogenase
MAGVSAAFQLALRGWSVSLVDKSEPGEATSYGNAGIIQREAVEPTAMPRDLATLASIAVGLTNDVRYDVTALPRHIRPLFSYWWYSAPKRYRTIAAAYATLINTATSEHQVLIDAAGGSNLIRREGFRVFYRTKPSLDGALKAADRVAATQGVPFRHMSAGELADAEPALARVSAVEKIAGAIHWLAPWTVAEPGALVKAYADGFRRLGGTIVRGDATSLAETSDGGWRVQTVDGPIEAEHAVVALGPWSPKLLAPLGYDFPMVLKRGYHKHYAAPEPLKLPLGDRDFGYMMAPMLRGIRITTGAELGHADAPSTPVQLGRAENAARSLIDLGSAVETDPWFGTRPCMPDMLPVVGAAPRHKGLWFDFGHGHQGFTLGPTTGRLIADLMEGVTPFVSEEPFRSERWAR